MTDITTEQDQSTPFIAEPSGIGGWLLYFCIAFTILTPVRVLGWMQHTSAGLMLATYTAIALTSFVAGVTLWATRPSALLFVRIALIARLLYSFFQFYRAVELANNQYSMSINLAEQEFLYSTINILQVFLLFFYFRFSKRVRNTFGRNI